MAINRGVLRLSGKRLQARFASNSLASVQQLLPGIQASRPFASELVAELRSDHAGETGAVWIYKGAAFASRLRQLPEPALGFVHEHMGTEQEHLDLWNGVLRPDEKSKLLVLWRGAGFALGALPVLVGGAPALFATVDAVETFVEEHYSNQLHYLCKNAPPGESSQHPELATLIRHCMEDEVHHRDDARARWHDAADASGHSSDKPSWSQSRILTSWAKLIDAGSRAAVVAAKRV
jgi:ubiquinone biosynthesis monooxygenase Coq7